MPVVFAANRAFPRIRISLMWVLAALCIGSVSGCGGPKANAGLTRAIAVAKGGLANAEGEYPVKLQSASSESCVLMNTGRIFCWGANYGNLYGIDEVLIATPQQIPGANAIDIAMTEIDGMCLVNLEREVWCEHAERGSEPKWFAANSCALQAGLQQVCSVSCADELSCWTTAGTPTELGSVLNQQLAVGTNVVLWLDETGATRTRPELAPAPDASSVEKVYTYLGAVCISTTLQNDYCFDGSTKTWVPAEEITERGEYDASCELIDGQVHCWGENWTGKLGADPHQKPILARSSANIVPLNGETKQLETGFGYACVLQADHRVLCWGLGWHAQLGDGQEMAHHEPVKVPGKIGYRAIHSQFSQIYAEDEQSRMWFWGRGYVSDIPEWWATPTRAPWLDGSTTISGLCARRGDTWTCYDHATRSVEFAVEGRSIVGTGSEWCWSDDEGNHCADEKQSGPSAMNEVAQRLPTVTSLKFVDKGLCGTTKDAIVCEFLETDSLRVPLFEPRFVESNLVRDGNGVYYELLAGTKRSLQPLELPDIAVEKVVSSEEGVCVLSHGGEVWCKYDSKEDMGRPGRDFPVDQWAQVEGLPPVTDIAEGLASTCILSEEGTIWCWGFAGEAGLANGVTGTRWKPGEVALP